MMTRLFRSLSPILNGSSKCWKGFECEPIVGQSTKCVGETGFEQGGSLTFKSHRPLLLMHWYLEHGAGEGRWKRRNFFSNGGDKPGEFSVSTPTISPQLRQQISTLRITILVESRS